MKELENYQMPALNKTGTIDEYISSLRFHVAANLDRVYGFSDLHKKYITLGIPYPSGERFVSNHRKEWITEIKPLTGDHTPTAVVVIAHPDDEAFVGGTIAKIAKQGKRVVVISLTDGAAGTKHTARHEMVMIRREEEKKALSRLGANIYINLGFPDAKLRAHEQEAIESLTQYFRVFDPAIVIAHRQQDYHMDHRAVSHIAEDALFNARNANDVISGIPQTVRIPALYAMDPQGLMTETGRVTMDITTIVNINDTLDIKLASFAFHESQVTAPGPDGKNYIDKSRQEARRRGNIAHFGYAEALRRIDYGGEAFQANDAILKEWLGKKNVLTIPKRQLRRTVLFIMNDLLSSLHFSKK